jgi:hypothetical protein
MDNLNTPEGVDNIRTDLLQQLGDLQGAPSVAMHEVPPLYQRAEKDAEDDYHTVERRVHGSELYDSVD